LVAGDVFDSSTPSNRAQELYYRFLGRIANGSGLCRHVVLIAGNHDSPSLLDAPKGLLHQLNVHVVGGPCDPIEEEAIVLFDKNGAPELIVCAIPFLRDRDLRVAEAGESIDDKNRKLITGLRNHYAAVAAAAVDKKNELGVDLPIVAMGHLFTVGGQTNDGVRELYVGSLAQVEASIFPDCLGYVGLGHLHTPQIVGGSDRIRYCGSGVAYRRVMTSVGFRRRSRLGVCSVSAPRASDRQDRRSEWPRRVKGDATRFRSCIRMLPA
jgi:exonuclease SbcD